MIKPATTEQLAIDILKRSICSVQVGAVIEDSTGIVSWGWNGCHTGYGIHAEKHAINRANKKRLRGSTIYVASQRKRNSKIVMSKPCEECQPLIFKWGLKVIYRDAGGEWQKGNY